MGVSQCFGTNIITENYLGTFLHCFLVVHGVKWAKNATNWTKMSSLGQIWVKNPFFEGAGVKLLVPSYQGANETPLSC